MQDIGRQLAIAARWLPIIAIVAVLAGAAVYVVAGAQTRIYESTALLNVEPGPNPSLGDLTVSEQLALAHARRAGTTAVASNVIDAVGLDIEPGDLDRVVSVDAESGSSLVRVSARDADPERAALLATAMTDELIRRSVEQTRVTGTDTVDTYLAGIRSEVARGQERLDELLAITVPTSTQTAEIASLESRLASLQSTYADLVLLSSAYERNRLVVFEPAGIPDSPVEPRPLLLAGLAVISAMFAALAAVFFFEYLMGWIRDESDLRDAAGAPSLGPVVERRGDIAAGPGARLVTLHAAGSEPARSYRNVVDRVDRAAGALRVLLVAGWGQDRGRSAVAANLAIENARAGRRVLLVDGALERPTLHEFFGLENGSGVSTMLAYDASVSLVALPTGLPALRLIPAGPERLAGASSIDAAAGRFMQKLLAEADLVVIDSPDESVRAMARLAGGVPSGALLVIDKGTRRSRVTGLVESLDAAGTSIVGAVLRSTTRGRTRPVQRPAPEPVDPPMAPDQASTYSYPAADRARVAIEPSGQPGPYALPVEDQQGEPAGSGTTTNAS